MNGKILKRILVLLTVFVCSGCALMQPTDPYRAAGIQMPVASESPAGLPSTKQPEGPLELSQAIEIALINNPDITAAVWDIEAAQAQRDLGFGEMLPSLRAVGGYSHYNFPQRLIPKRGETAPGPFKNDPETFSRNIASEDLVLSMPLFTGGRLINQVKAAELLKIAANHRLARSRKELIFNVSSVFFNILAQKRVIESLEFSRQTLQEHLKQVEALVTAQKAARVDRMRTEVRLADIEQRLVREENVKIIYQRVLVNLLGLKNPSGAISVRGNLAVAQKASIPDLETALAKAWSSRDDFLSARSSVEAQARNVDVARAGHWPTLSLQGAYGERWAIGSVSGSGDRDSEVYRIGIAVDIPIFEGGRVEARVRDQRAKLASAKERFRKLDLQIRLDVETALLNVNSSWERIEAIKKAIEQAQESFRIERQKYDFSKGAIVDVLDAQSALLDSQTNYDRALADYNIALAQLRLAMGGEL
jgi:outer membrane protein